MKKPNLILSMKAFAIAIFICFVATTVKSRFFSKQFILPDINDTPVIGIYAQPSWDKYGYATKDYQYVLNANIQWINMSGAQTLIIPFDETPEYYNDIFSKINGILFTGGDLNININVPIRFQQPGKNQWTENAAYLIDLAIKANDNGDFFPIWGNCQGFQLLNYAVSGFNYTILNHITNDFNYTRNVQLWHADNSNLYSQFNYDWIDYSETKAPFLYLHELGITESDYKHNPKLAQFFKILGVSANSTDIYSSKAFQYIAIVEGHKYPFAGVQFHPEYSIFQWGFNSNRSTKALEIASYFSKYFISLARKNGHKFSSVEEMKSKLSYNLPSVHIQTSLFNLITFMPRKQNV